MGCASADCYHHGVAVPASESLPSIPIDTLCPTTVLFRLAQQRFAALL